MAVALRMDLRQPVPLRRTPEFLYGDIRRRARRAAAGGGFALALVIGAGLWLVRQDAGFRPDVPAAVVPAATMAATTRPAAEEFPLILDSPTPVSRSATETATPLTLLQPLAQPPVPVESRPPTAPEATPPTQTLPESLPASPAAPVTADQHSSPPVSTASPPEAVKTTPPVPVAEAPEPAPRAAASAAPAGAAPNVPANYILQLGTYRLEESARDDQEHYRSLGIDTIILRRGTYLVLRLPPFDSREEAEREESRLRRKGITPLFIPPTEPEE
jgi:cell division protein FtsN